MVGCSDSVKHAPISLIYCPAALARVRCSFTRGDEMGVGEESVSLDVIFLYNFF